MNQDDRLGPYRLLKRLGEGGMGVVHLALDARGRQVAVKVLRSEVAGDDVARRRLSREVETMRRVRGSHIAEVVDADVTGRRPYIVTRYVPGRALDEIVKEDGPLPVNVLLKVARGVAEALTAVHAAGVVHRDLKPGNVLMVDEEPVLIDFGIAQAVDATRLTQTGMFIGTPGYLAPEIIEGQEGGSEIDVHAWAGTLLFAATGQPPFGKGTLEMIFFNITSGKADVEAAPAVLQPVLRAAFHRDPAKRPTAAELLQWIDRLTPRASGSRVPDEITTVADLDDAPEVPATGGGFVSLLGDAPEAGDPFPTVRVTAEDLRDLAARGGAGLPGEGDIPTRRVTSEELRESLRGGHTLHEQASHAQSAYDAGSQGLRPPAGTTSGTQESHGHEQTPHVQQQRPEAFLPTVRVPPVGPPAGPSPGSQHGFGVPPHVADPRRPAPHTTASPMGAPYTGLGNTAAPHPVNPHAVSPHPVSAHGMVAGTARTLPEENGPGHGGLTQQSHGGPPVRPSGAYGVAAVSLLVAMTALAVIAPFRVFLFAAPAVILLRAADFAQPRLSSRRPPAAAAGDVLRVLGDPAALIRSIGVTIALVPYGALLGLFVTVIMVWAVGSMPVWAALNWGFAVGLWTVCAGPGVQAPGRQMRRTLASLAPGGAAARGLAWGAAGVAALVGVIALTSLVGTPLAGHLWGSVEFGSVLQRLQILHEARNR
ncbi:hypothetical protein Pth03_41640 [Planotetraspora thailandica]|uniref:Protein kinase domain-containing protein n=1 Tax=Planotetraspora thailandica TaxID=487172 RepID=A0A8J3XX76_9ACTN|nr:serine/threonine-protein kinase [Planotetraspora thailandica]GII55775.1 hypothetical protein Pth03_41640 [Planotetraspora thailandica]